MLFALYKKIKNDLDIKNVEVPDIAARRILEHVLDVSFEDICLDRALDVTPENKMQIDEIMIAHVAGEPLTKIFGLAHFWGMEFKVTKETLDPRSDSEVLIEAILKTYPDKSAPLTVLDLGTGTGCLALAVLSEYKNAVADAVDVSSGAIRVAQENAARHDLTTRVTFHESSWSDFKAVRRYDLVISNPPYIPISDFSDMDDAVKNFDPHGALFAGADGLDDYRDLAKIIPKLLKTEKSKTVLEIGFNQAQQVTEIFKQNGFKDILVYRDLGNRDRCLCLSYGANREKSLEN